MNTLKAERRDGEAKAKRLRREGYVTGSLFGKDIEGGISIQMDALEVKALLKKDWKDSEIILELDGQERHVIIKEIQFNYLRHQYLEVDFQTISKEESNV